MQFYTKGEDGEFAEATQEQVDATFKDRFERYKKSESTNIRNEVEGALRSELTTKITEDLTKKLEGDYKSKLKSVEDEKLKLQTNIRQKTVAAEYGFGAEIESFLGDGTEEDMRAKAEILKKNRTNSTVTVPEKKTITSVKSGFVKKTD